MSIGPAGMAFMLLRTFPLGFAEEAIGTVLIVRDVYFFIEICYLIEARTGRVRELPHSDRCRDLILKQDVKPCYFTLCVAV